MKKYLILTFSLAFHFTVLPAQSDFTLRIDPDNARGGNAMQVFDSIEFIPLETNKQSLFGSIDQMEVTDSFLIILDMNSQSVLLFNRDGSFHKRITSGGADKYFFYFSINRQLNQIIINNNFDDNLLVYDFYGKLVSKLSRPESRKLSSFFDFSNGNVLYNLNRSQKSKDTSFHPFDLAFSKGYNSIFKYLNEYNPRIQNGNYDQERNAINFSGEPGSCIFSLPYSYTLYQLNDTGIIRKYNFIFPLQYSLPPNFAIDSAYAGKRMQYVRTPENWEKIAAINSTYKVGDYLLFSVVNHIMRIDKPKNYLYNLTNNNLISFSRVTGDSTSFYFPILSSALEKVEAVNNNMVFTSIPSVRLLSLAKNINKEVNYPKSLKELITTGSKTNNPVIIQFRLKPNL